MKTPTTRVEAAEAMLQIEREIAELEAKNLPPDMLAAEMGVDQVEATEGPLWTWIIRNHPELWSVLSITKAGLDRYEVSIALDDEGKGRSTELPKVFTYIEEGSW
jgi:hypothetical protein